MTNGIVKGVMMVEEMLNENIYLRQIKKNYTQFNLRSVGGRNSLPHFHTQSSLRV